MDSSELRDQLLSLLKWDSVIADGISAAITQASSRADIDAIVEDYIPASETQARKVVANYAAAKFLKTKQSQAAGQGLPIVSDDDLKASLFMGVNVKTTVKKRSNANAADGLEKSAPVLAKKVVNCLKCGKIFDCRQPNGDAMRFLGTGGWCTYCGNRVRLTYIDGSSSDDAIKEDEMVNEISNIDMAAVATTNEALAFQKKEAEALRDRLVEFDRQAAKRTTVIDDQSDYFAIDSNAWLSDEERAELKRRQAEAEAAADAAKKRMTVTVDLLGRRVVMDNGGENDGSILDAEGLSSENLAAIEAAMAATAAEKPQGGGSAVAAFDSIRNTSTKMMPSGGSSKYIFIGDKSAKGGGGGEGKEKKGRSGKQPVVERLQHDGKLLREKNENVFE
jgi:hypothetical protein